MVNEESRIELLEESRLTGCARLFAAVFGSEPWNEPWTEEGARERLRDILGTPGYLGLVVVEGEEILGFAAGSAWRHAEGRLFYLYEMCVRPEAQGRGIGGRLLKDLHDRLDRMGVERVFLLTGRDGPAEAFYAKNGYVVDPTLVAMYREAR
jgi:aminoglycoside 6'-N-acetyltransferase I